MLQKYPLKKIIQAEGLVPLKKLGQNFIFDSGLTDQIAFSASLNQDSIVYEVGPGPGGLTESILKLGVQKLIAIEQDSRCFNILAKLKLKYPQLILLNDDALNINEAKFITEKTKIIANLPYNIGTALLIKWIYQRDLWQDFTLMLQKEVVDRITAVPGSKDYGRLSIICQIFCDCETLLTIGPEFFYPPPKVHSTIVRLVPKLEIPSIEIIKKVEIITRELFNNRRKMIKAALKRFNADLDQLLSGTDISLTMRPEEIPISQYLILAKNLLDIEINN